MQNSTSTPEDFCEEDWEKSDEILQLTNKRITLNLLIQGAAMHTFLTAHHLVREELESVRPGLTRCYDQAAACFSLCYFIGDIPLLYGLPSIFWARTHRPSHLYHRHRLLATHGRELWRESKRYLIARAWQKGIIAFPVFQYVQMIWLLTRLAWIERSRKFPLAKLAEKANSLIWDIPQDRLEAEMTAQVAFGNLRVPKTVKGRMIRSGAIGYGGVDRQGKNFTVVAKAWNWPLLSHELTKGIVELICLHGINTLDDETYKLVTDEADQIERETWMLQAGSEMWRRLLAVLPEQRPLPESIMHIARLDPKPLEQLMMAVVEDPKRAKQLLENLD